MLERCDYRQARDVMMGCVSPVGTEEVSLSACAGRVLARQLVAGADIPPFDRSPYDGYAFRAEDVEKASPRSPVTLRIVDYIAAGDLPHVALTGGTAARLMTGAPVPEGADAVLPFEKTRFTEQEVTIETPVTAGTNVIYAGEDVQKGTVLCHPGARIDAGLAGTLAGQGIIAPLVYKKPLVAVISTGTEILEEGEAAAPGRIYNSNRYSLQAACQLAGCETVYIGTARDDADVIAQMIEEAFGKCHAVILSGGVSVGDFDCTPAAMEKAGVQILAHGLALKPGMAGAYGIYRAEGEQVSGESYAPGNSRESVISSESSAPGNRREKVIPVFGLSGNPAACMTAFYALVLPVLRRQMGIAPEGCVTEHIRVRLAEDYSRRNQSCRLLRGRVDLTAAVQEMEITGRQGNQVLSSLAGSNAFAEIPAGASVRAGQEVDAFLLGEPGLF